MSASPRGAVPVVVNITPPQISLTSPGPGASVSGTVTVEAAVTDNFAIDRVEFYADDQFLGAAIEAPYKIDWQTDSLANQSYQLKAVALDAAGNSTESTAAVEVSNNIVTPLGGVFVSPDGLVLLDFPLGAVSETVIIKYVRLPDRAVGGFSQATGFFDLTAETLDGRPVNIFAHPYTMTITGVPSGANLDLYFFDAGGRWQVVPGSVATNGTITAWLDHLTVFALLADTEAPTTTVTLSTSEAPSGWRTAPTLVTLDATDSGSGVATINYQWDTASGPWQTYGGAITAPEGGHTLYYRAADSAGNAEVVQSLILRVDIIAPTSAIISPAEGALVRGLISVEVTAADAGSGIETVAFSLNDATIPGPTAGPYVFDLDTAGHPDGAYSLITRAFDKAANSSSATINFNIDNTAPSIVSVSPSADATNVDVGTSMAVTFNDANGIDTSSVNENTLVLKDMFDTTVAAGLTYNQQTRTAVLTPLLPLENGRIYSVRLSGDIRDIAGNSIETQSWSFMTADNLPPVILDEAPQETTNTYRPTISATTFDLGLAVDPESISLKLDGTTQTPTFDPATGLVSYAPQADLSLGRHNVMLAVKDMGGNEAMSSWSFLVFGTPVGGAVSANAVLDRQRQPLHCPKPDYRQFRRHSDPSAGDGC